MIVRPQQTLSLQFLAAFLFACLAPLALPAQQPNAAAVIRGVDAAVKARLDRIASYTVTEHYAVYRNNDETHPAAEMTVKTTYRKESGKSYAILSQSGSPILRNFVLGPLLDHEKEINQPATRQAAFFISANYEMQLQPGGIQQIDGRDCLALAINPKHKAPNLIQGTLWVDARDYSIVRLEGTASKSPSLLTGPAQVMRQYTKVSGFAQAAHARAVSTSPLFGQTVVTIDYRDYAIQLQPAN
jgi:outer membrane lipoprotein-sorting protein